MVFSKQVASAYTSRWNANVSTLPRRVDISAPPSPLGGVRSKYNSSCNSCRRSRVKCSGGNPCQRCATSKNFSSCAYSISRRRGKRRASDSQASDMQNSSGHLVIPISSNESPELDMINIDHWVGFNENLWSGLNDSTQVSSIEIPQSTHQQYAQYSRERVFRATKRLCLVSACQKLTQTLLLQLS
jgi:hypothetical protein